MNQKNNKRRRESREKIQAAFLELIQTKPISRITVAEICAKTGLNRSTFYANYQDVYDLADQIRNQLVQNLSELYENNIASNVGRDYLRLFYHIRDNKVLYDTYFKLGYDAGHAIELDAISQVQRVFPDDHLEYHIAFHKAGLNAIIMKWLTSGCAEDPETMVQIIQNEYRGRKMP